LYYYASCLYDGTIVASFPIRKPIPKSIKQDNIKIDEDGVCDNGWYSTGKEFSDVNVENRFRFQDIIATRLNTRRAIREMVFPYLQKLQKDIDQVNNKLDNIQHLFEIQQSKV
jgi:hypothetical protein